MRHRTVPRSSPGEAAYQVLARDLRAAILRDDYTDGTALPTEAELASQYQVSRQTVRRAFHDLVAEGMVTRVRGRGTFASPHRGEYVRQFGSIDDLVAVSVDTTFQLITPLHRRVDLDAASRLRLSSDIVHTVTFRRLHDSVPLCVTTLFLPPAVGKLLEDVAVLTRPDVSASVTIIGLLDFRLKSPIAEAEQSITAVNASTHASEHLGCAPGEALLRIDRLYYSVNGDAVELATSYFLPAHYSYRVKLKRSVR